MSRELDSSHVTFYLLSLILIGFIWIPVGMWVQRHNDSMDDTCTDAIMYGEQLLAIGESNGYFDKYGGEFDFAPVHADEIFWQTVVRRYTEAKEECLEW